MARNERERTILRVGAAALATLLVYAIFFGPALSGRQKLSEALPRLRQQAAEMQALSKQAAELPAASNPRPISTPLIACTAITAWASLPSSFTSH